MLNSLALIVLSLLGGARAQICSGCTAPSASPLLSCRTSGDPHFVTWSAERFDFMGSGVFRLARVTTGCGCEIEVQTLQCPCSGGGPGSHCAPGATANMAVALRVGGAGPGSILLVFTSDEAVQVSGPGITSQTIQPSSAGPHTWGTSTLRLERETARTSRWRTSLPGGGQLVLYRTSMSSMPNGAALQVWLSLPSDAVAADASGLCAQPCLNLPPMPYPWCSTPEEDRCLPMTDTGSLFDSPTRQTLQGQCGLSASVRDTSTPCLNNDCDVLVYNSSYVGGIEMVGMQGDATVPSTYQAVAPDLVGMSIDTPERCLRFCTIATPAAPYMTFTPEETLTSGTYSFTTPSSCSCKGTGSPSPYPNAVRAKVCRPKCLPDEQRRTFINQLDVAVTGFEMGIDYNGNDIRCVTNVPSGARPKCPLSA